MLPIRAAAVAALTLGCLAAPAQADKLVIKGAPAPGPAQYDKVSVFTYGSKSAKTVLVLVPGTSGGAGSVAPVAEDLSMLVPGLQVWAAERRTQAFEDQSVFESGSLQEINDYYLSLGYQKPWAQAGDVPYVADWGLKVMTEDLRKVVLKASNGGKRKVVLGGHSRGASQVAAYAAWDFNGRPGFRDLAGLVLIDGGLLGFIDKGDSQPYTRKSAQEAVDEARQQPFNDILGLGIPAIAQIVGQTMGTYAAKDPDAPSVMQDEPIVPADLKPEFRVTNEAFLGYFFDATYSQPAFASLRTHSGELTEGDPRGWKSGEQTPMERFSGAFAGIEPDFTEWYYTQRMIIDVGAANPMRRDKPSTGLGLRLFHTAEIDTPLYAFETDLTSGRVLNSARRLVSRSRIKSKKLVKDHAMSHLDPVLASNDNTFVETVVPFLKKIAKR